MSFSNENRSEFTVQIPERLNVSVRRGRYKRYRERYGRYRVYVRNRTILRAITYDKFFRTISYKL